MKRNLAATGRGEPHQSVRNLRRLMLSTRAKALAARRQNKLSATSVVLLTFALALAPLFASRALPSAQASAALASDTFGRTVSNGWGSADVGGAWTILDNSSHWSVAPNAGTIAVTPNSQERGILQSIQAQDVDLLTEVMLPQCAGSSNCVAYSLARVSSGASPTYYRIGLAQSTSVSTVRVRTQRSDGTNVASDLATSIPAVNGAILWLHVQIQGINPTTLRARAWQNGSSEPSVWLLNVNDSNAAQQISNGNLGVRVRNEDASAGHIFQYLDYQALPLNSTPTPTPTPTPSSSPPPSPSPTPSIAVADAFNRSVTNGWGTADVGGAWTVIDTAANWSVSPGAGSITVGAGGQERAVLGSISVQDVDLLAEMQLPRSGGTANCFGFVMGRYAAGTPTYYRIGAVQGPRSTVFLRTQRSDGTYIVGDLDTGIAAVDGVTLWVRAEFEGINPTKLRGRVWQAGAPEPTTWLLTATDSTGTEQLAGAVGVRARNEDNASHTFRYLSYQAGAITSPAPTPTPSPSPTPTPTPPPPPPPPPPSGTAASDSFQRTASSGWSHADTGGWWTVVGSPWLWSASPGAGSVTVGANAEELAYLSQFTVQDIDVLEQVSVPRCASNNCGAFVIGRYAPAFSPTYYRVGAVQGTGRAHIFLRTERSDGTPIGSDIDTGLSAADGTWLLQRVQFIGVNPTVIRARVWPAGSAEPSGWLLSTTDSNSAQQAAGMVGVRLRNEDTSANHTFQVTSYQATGTATAVTVTPNPTGPAHWVYVINDGQVYVYDIDNNHALVKQFPIPEAGKRGTAMAPSRGLLYITECGLGLCQDSRGSLLAYDLVNDVVAWIANYSFGIDQPAVTPDGLTIYMPHGLDSGDPNYSILDASNGRPIGSTNAGVIGHNTIASLDGTQVYFAGHTGSNANYLQAASTATNQVIFGAGPTINGIGPYTVNGRHTLAFTASSNTCGFQVLDLNNDANRGKVLYTVTFSGSCIWTATDQPSHGVSLSPDETRVYVMDAATDQLQVYDVSGLPGSAPSFVAAVQLNSLSGSESPCNTWCEHEGWVLNDLSGRYVYVGDAGNVVSTSTLSSVITLPALQNTRQVIEIDWSGGVPNATSTRFGLGRVTS